MEFDPELIVPDKNKSVLQGALVPWGEVKGKYLYHMLKGLADFYGFSLDTPFVEYFYGFSLDTPFVELKPEFQEIILYGSGKIKIPFKYQNDEQSTYWSYKNSFEGVINNLSSGKLKCYY